MNYFGEIRNKLIDNKKVSALLIELSWRDCL